MQCQEVRKRKELELQILTEAIRSWEGDDIKTLGNVIYMSQVLIQCAGSEVPQCASAIPSTAFLGPLHVAGLGGACLGHGFPAFLHFRERCVDGDAWKCCLRFSFCVSF